MMPWFVYLALTISHLILLVTLAALIIHARILTEVSQKLFDAFGPQAPVRPHHGYGYPVEGAPDCEGKT